jgi:hypothetical protein
MAWRAAASLGGMHICRGRARSMAPVMVSGNATPGNYPLCENAVCLFTAVCTFSCFCGQRVASGRRIRNAGRITHVAVHEGAPRAAGIDIVGEFQKNLGRELSLHGGEPNARHCSVATRLHHTRVHTHRSRPAYIHALRFARTLKPIIHRRIVVAIADQP